MLRANKALVSYRPLGLLPAGSAVLLVLLQWVTISYYCLSCGSVLIIYLAWHIP